MKWEVRGYCRDTGNKKVIRVEATGIKHAKTVAYAWLTYPVVVGRV